MSGNEPFRAEWPSDPAEYESRMPQQRRKRLAVVRWILIGMCLILVAYHPRSAALLAPLLVLAVFLGRHRTRSAAADRQAAAEAAPVKRSAMPN